MRDNEGVTGHGHVPVLLGRVMSLLAPAFATSPSPVYVDGTLGMGGHAYAMLEAHPDLRLIGLDRDTTALDRSRTRLAPFGDRVTLVHAIYDELPSVLGELGVDRVHGVLFDLGVSSPQLDEVDRGFAYSYDAPLDMRMDRTQDLTAADVVNGYSVGQLARILREYGEERFAVRVAQAIVRERAKEPLTSTRTLAELVRTAIPAATRPSGPSRRCASRSTASWPRGNGHCPPLSTPSRSAAGSWCSPTTRWRTASPSGHWPSAPPTARHRTCRCRCPSSSRPSGC